MYTIPGGSTPSPLTLSGSPPSGSISSQEEFNAYLSSPRSRSTSHGRIKKEDIEPFSEFLFTSIGRRTVKVEFSHNLTDALHTDPQKIIFSSELERTRLNRVPRRIVSLEHMKQFSQDLIKNKTLTELYFIGVDLNLEYFAPLSHALKIHMHLRILVLRGNPLGCPPELLAVLDAQSHLEELDLSKTCLSQEDLGRLAPTLARHRSLKIIDLSRNGAITAFHNDTLENFAQTVLTTNTVLRVLRLKQCRISAWEASRFAEALRFNSTLTTLDLSGNKIKTLFDHQPLSIVSSKLVYGERIRVNTFAELLAMENTPLERLDLSGNNIDDQGALELSDALSLPTSAPSLRVLDLSNNPPISDEVINRLIECIRNKPHLSLIVSSPLVKGKINLAIFHKQCFPKLKELCWKLLRTNPVILLGTSSN